jgi:hypothetical protein
LITVTFNHENPRQVRDDMAAMLGVTAPASDASPAAGAFAGPMAEQQRVLTADTAEAPSRTTRGRKPKAETPAQPADPQPEQQNIQTGGERNPPAEEQKRPEAPPQPELKPDDVRKVAGTYVQKFGMENAQVDVANLMEGIAGVRVMSQLEGKPQEKLKEIVDKITECVASGKQYVAPAPTGTLA